MTLEQMLERLRKLGRWTWRERDNDRWGNYMSASPVADAKRAQVKILIDPDDLDWFAVNVLFESDRPTTPEDLRNLRDVLFTRILPAIDAAQLTETEDYE
jgi:hypothetical protein